MLLANHGHVMREEDQLAGTRYLERVAIACTVRSPGFSRNRLALEPFRLKAGLQTSLH